MKVVIALILAAACSQAPASWAGDSRVVFVRDNQIYTASEDGSNLRQLTSDRSPKQMPKWSPDGTEIAFLTDGDMHADPKSLAKIEVITVDGKHVGTAPVLVTMPDGTEVLGMGGVESIGWFDAQHVFAEGGVNPYVEEFRTMDIRTGEMGGVMEGGAYAICPSKGRIAFWAPIFPPDVALQLQVNAEETNRFTFPDSNKLPDIDIPLLWTPGCDNVAFVDPRPPAALVLIGADRGERKAPLPGWGAEMAGLTPVNGGLLLKGAHQALVYDFHQNTAAEAPQTLLDQLDTERAAHERVVRELKAESADWWTAK